MSAYFLWWRLHQWSICVVSDGRSVCHPALTAHKKWPLKWQMCPLPPLCVRGCLDPNADIIIIIKGVPGTFVPPALFHPSTHPTGDKKHNTDAHKRGVKCPVAIWPLALKGHQDGDVLTEVVGGLGVATGTPWGAGTVKVWAHSDGGRCFIPIGPWGQSLDKRSTGGHPLKVCRGQLMSIIGSIKSGLGFSLMSVCASKLSPIFNLL